MKTVEYGKVISARVPKEVYNQLAVMAKKRKMKRTDIVRTAVAEYLGFKYVPEHYEKKEMKG